MSQISEAIQEHFDTCRDEMGKKYVSWVWVVLMFFGMVTAIVGATIYTVEGIGKADNKATQAIEQNVNQERRINEQDAEIRENLRWMRENWGKR